MEACGYGREFTSVDGVQTAHAKTLAGPPASILTRAFQPVGVPLLGVGCDARISGSDALVSAPPPTGRVPAGQGASPSAEAPLAMLVPICVLT